MDNYVFYAFKCYKRIIGTSITSVILDNLPNSVDIAAKFDDDDGRSILYTVDLADNTQYIEYKDKIYKTSEDFQNLNKQIEQENLIQQLQKLQS